MTWCVWKAGWQGVMCRVFSFLTGLDIFSMQLDDKTEQRQRLLQVLPIADLNVAPKVQIQD